MLISLTARGFRNLEPFTWRPGAGSHLILGGNGAGKTSLLEAIYVLATTKSFRSAQLADCAHHNNDAFRLAGEVEGQTRTQLAVEWSRGGDKGRAVNGKPSTLAEHLTALPVVAWTTGDGDLLTGPPELRRRFLDRGVLGLRPVALAPLARYRQALRAKRELLARPPGGGAGRWEAEVAPWNQLLAETGAEVIRLRRGYAARLAGELAEVLVAAGLPFPAVAVSYRPSPRSSPGSPAVADGTADATAEEIGERLRRAAGRERERGLPLIGPHRDELEIRWGGQPLRGTVSAGERKALGLLLHAAHGRLLTAAGRPPVYLLDDADAELAPGTLAAVWRVFSGSAQLFVSSNRPRVWEGLEVGSTQAVEGGRLRPTPGPAMTS